MSPTTSPVMASHVTPITPESALRSAIVTVLKPNPSTVTKAALDQKRKKRKRIQRKEGECLTIARLQAEEDERKKKKLKKNEIMKTPAQKEG